MKNFLAGVVSVVLFIAIIIGCSKTNTIVLTAADITGAAAGTATSTPGVVGTPTATKTVEPAVAAGFIDNCNDGNNANQTLWATGQFGMTGPGYWYTFNDRANAGTSYVVPWGAPDFAATGVPAIDFYMQSPGCDGAGNDDPAGMAVRITGFTAVTYQYGSVGVGINLIGEILPASLTFTCSPNYGPSTLNISAYTGLRFWTKGDGSSYIVKIPWADDCNKTLSAYNDFSSTFTTSSTWTLKTIPFTSFATAGGWGTPPPNIATVLAVARAIQWCTPNAIDRAATPGVDLYLDNIELY